MKKYLIALTVFMLFLPGFVFSDLVTFKVGLYFPRAQSDLWDTEFENMSFTKSNYQSTNFGFGYEYFLSNQISVVFNVEGYTKQKSGSYEGYVGYYDDDGTWAYPNDYEGEFIPGHVFSVSNTPIQISLKLAPTGRNNKFIPFIGGGIGIYLWNVRLQGEMIDFSDEWYDLEEEVTIYPIHSTDAREENKFSIGYHVFGGFMMPVANRVSLDVEFKYNILKGTLKDAFQGFEPFDLSGYQISIGMNYWF